MEMTVELDLIDKKLLNLLQTSFPLVEQPYLEMANLLATNEADILVRIQRLKDEKVIRQISPIFDTKSLGYQSSLVAAEVKSEHIEYAAAIINQHPGVSHNYERAHQFNLWFTIAIPPDSLLGLEQTVAKLGELAKVSAIRLLPTIKLFKIGVKLDLENANNTEITEEAVYNKMVHSKDANLSQLDIAVVREAQANLPIESKPFTAIAERIGISVSELLIKLQEMKDNGQMRRFAAVLHHRQAGFKVNTMGVWSVPEERIEAVGQQLARFTAVSHCYQRPSYSDWPYNVFTMIHGRDRENCEQILQSMSETVEVYKYGALYSLREFKKVRVKYFSQDILAWEKEAIK